MFEEGWGEGRSWVAYEVVEEDGEEGGGGLSGVVGVVGVVGEEEGGESVFQTTNILTRSIRRPETKVQADTKVQRVQQRLVPGLHIGIIPILRKISKNLRSQSVHADGGRPPWGRRYQFFAGEFGKVLVD